MRYLSFAEVLLLHQGVVAQSGGSQGIRDLGRLESAIAQPRMEFGGQPLYPSLEEKAVALGFSLIMNHPFIDGNKRIGHAAMEAFLMMNGHELSAPVEDAERTILAVASGTMSRGALTDWLRKHLAAIPG